MSESHITMQCSCTSADDEVCASHSDRLLQKSPRQGRPHSRAKDRQSLSLMLDLKKGMGAVFPSVLTQHSGTSAAHQSLSHVPEEGNDAGLRDVSTCDVLRWLDEGTWGVVMLGKGDLEMSSRVFILHACTPQPSCRSSRLFSVPTGQSASQLRAGGHPTQHPSGMSASRRDFGSPLLSTAPAAPTPAPACQLPLAKLAAARIELASSTL